MTLDPVGLAVAPTSGGELTGARRRLVAGIGRVAPRVPPSWTITVVLAGLWLVAGPPTPDLAAQVHRVGSFASQGFAVWDNSWYDGHHLPGYSLVFPAVGATIGVRLAGGLAAVLSAVLFEALLVRRRASAACWWFAVGCSADLFIGRLTYALGVSIGLGAFTALMRSRPRLAIGLAVACAATSPVAGLFLALAGVGHAAVDRRREGLVMGAFALAAVFALSAAFPEGGTQPFSWSSFAVTAAISLAAGLAVGRDRRLRVPLLLYLLAVIVCFAVPSPMGGNVTRLGTAFVAPTLLVAVRRAPGMRRIAIMVILSGAAVWQWVDPFTQMAHGWDDPSAFRSYYQPLIARLRLEEARPGRVEVPFTRGHWETVYLAREFALARGWERQLDRRLNPLFYTRRLDANGYHRWLRANAVRFVALPDAPMDDAGRQEARLVGHGQSFLQPIWTGGHWRVFRVRDPLPLASRRAASVSLSGATVRLAVRRPGPILLRVHWTPYWSVTTGTGCVSRRGAWTGLLARGTGTFTLTARFSLDRLLEGLPVCRIQPRPAEVS
jgi:hypothetical protein